MKRTISLLICFAMVLGVFAFGPLSLNSSAAPLFKDTFDYASFSGDGIYDSTKIWESEYEMTNSDTDFGYFDGIAPTLAGGVASFSDGYGLRFNWQNISGFTFNSSKTYTLSFDVRVTDFGDDVPLGSISSWNREIYFAVGGYYNQIEFRSGNYTNQLGIRAGDKTDTYTKGGWTNDLTTYLKDTTYNCTVQWTPSAKTIVSTVKNGDTVIAQGARTSDWYADYNKYTRSFVWRCEDGGFQLDNVKFTDGTNTYTQQFATGAMTSGGIWGIEDVQKTDATAPTLSNGVLKFGEKNSVRFNWTNVGGAGDFDQASTYVFKFDAKVTDKGDGSTWGGSSNTRALYVAFGGWYNVIEIPTSSDTVKIGSNTATFTDATYLNKTLHVEIRWTGNDIAAKITDDSGNQLISGDRNSTSFTDMTAENAAMTYLVLRCEDGAVEIDNFEFNVQGNNLINTSALNIQGNQQAIYECDIDFNGEGNVNVKLGGSSLAYISATEMKVAGKGIGKEVSRTFGVGTYKLKAMVNPAQTMVSAWLTGPNGEVVQRGFYNLLGENTVYAYATEGNDVRNIKVSCENVILNDYTIQTTEPVYTGYNAKVYNLISSFDDAQTTRNFAWTALSSYINGGAMQVKYRVEGTSAWTYVDAVKVDKLASTVESEQSYYVEEDYYKCDLTGLTADTAYEYKVGKKGSTDETNDWSQIYTFTTAPEEIEEFTFIAVGDTQGLSWDGTNTSTKGFMYAKAAYDEAFQEVDNVAFMLHTGDVVERGWRQDYWNYYFKSVVDYSPSTPMFTAIGNHDTQCNPDHHFYFDYHYNHPNNGGAAALDSSITANITNQYVLNTVNNPNELIYSFDYGNAHFIVLNTGAYNYDNDHLLLEAQREWLINDLKANADAKWKIMLFHEPVYHRAGGIEDRPWLNTVIEGYGVDLVIQGHSHLVTRTYPMKNGQIVTKTNPDNILKGVGTVYTTIGSTTLNHDGASDTAHVEEIYGMSTPILSQPAYTYITVKEDNLEVTIKQIDGLVLDNFNIDVNNPVPPEVQDNGNLARYRPYTTEGIYSTDTGIPYPDENGMTMTDGLAADSLASYDNAAFAGFNKQTDAYVNNGYASITVDLGEKYSLNKLVARVSTATETNVGAGVKNIANVDFYVSDDGASWKKAGSAVPALSGNNTNATLELATPVAGRYVQYRFTSEANWMMVSEVEAYGEAYVAPDVMKGDLNNNGEIDSVDYTLQKRAYFGTFAASDFAVSDINNNGEIDSLDYTLLKRAYFGTYVLQ